MSKLRVLLIITILFSMFSVCSFAASDEEIVYVSDFYFVDDFGTKNIISSNSNIYAKCYIERTDNDVEKAVPYELVMQIRIGGKLVSLTSEKGELNVSDGVKEVVVEGYINGSVSDCELHAYLFKDVGTLVPLANFAMYGSDVATLDKITVNNEIIPGFVPDTYEYVYKLDKYPSQTPVTRFYPTDFSSLKEVSGVFPKPITYKIISSDELTENEYKIIFDIAKNAKVIHCGEQKEKRKDANESKFKVFSLDSESDYTASITNKLSSHNSAVNSSNVTNYTTSSFLTFNLDGCDIATTEEITLFIRGKVNMSTIHPDLNICLYSYDSSNPTSYLGEKIDEKNISSDGKVTNNAQYYDYVFDITDFMASQIAEGNTSVTFILTFDDTQVVELWDSLKANNWPEGKAKDLIFGYVLNTAATRKHNGTTIIYGNGQPMIDYYEYVK